MGFLASRKVRNFCCLTYPICAILRQPEQTNPKDHGDTTDPHLRKDSNVTSLRNLKENPRIQGKHVCICSVYTGKSTGVFSLESVNFLWCFIKGGGILFIYVLHWGAEERDAQIWWRWWEAELWRWEERKRNYLSFLFTSGPKSGG